ncbi:MAG: hypothetical protein WD709_05265 [Gammaproteobacteria bacterium]
MLLWSQVVFTRAQAEQEGVLTRLQEQFLGIYMKAADSTDMAILSDNEFKDDRISIYFSPACSPDCDVMIRFYGGRSCIPPSREHCFVLAGDDDVLDSLTE